MAAIQFNARNGITVGVVSTPVIDASANGSLNSLFLTTPLPAASGGLGSPITGLVKGSGSAYSSATVAVDYVSPSVLSTFTAKQVFAAGSSTVTASINIPNNSTGNTPVAGDLYGIGTGLQWHNGTAVKQIAYSDGTNSSGTWTINTSGTAANATLAAQATSLAGGTVGGIPYQSLVGTTSFLAIGTANQVLTSNGTNAPQWISQSAMTVGNATQAVAATNISGGTAGAVPYQSSANTTLFVSPGTAGQFLTSNGVSAPTWTTLPVTLTSLTTGFSAAGGTTSKTLTVSNTITLSGTDGSTLNISTGGTLGSAAFTASTVYVAQTSLTGSAVLPSGTTAQRDGTPLAGYLRWNTDIDKPEAYHSASASWAGLGGATGGGADAVFYENGQTVTTNYTITTGNNAVSAGPITINTGVTVTIPTGSTWTIV